MPLRKIGQVGIVTISSEDGRVLDLDSRARDILGLPLKLLGLASRKPIQRMLDAEGRPYVPATIQHCVHPGVPHSAMRAIRWERGAEWRWFHRSALLKEGGSEVIAQVMAIQGPLAWRQRGWTCVACDTPTTAVADVNGRELCLSCWTKTQRFKSPLAGLV